MTPPHDRVWCARSVRVLESSGYLTLRRTAKPDVLVLRKCTIKNKEGKAIVEMEVAELGRWATCGTQVTRQEGPKCGNRWARVFEPV